MFYASSSFYDLKAQFIFNQKFVQDNMYFSASDNLYRHRH